MKNCLIYIFALQTLVDKSKMAKFISHFLVALFQLLLFCFPGDMLMQQVNDI